MDVMPIIDVLIIHHRGGDAAEAVAPLHVFEETALELVGVAVDEAVGIVAEDAHLALVALAHAVALEAVLVAALLLAHLAVPPELLEAFGFDSVRDCLRRQEVVLPHGEDSRRFGIWISIWGKIETLTLGLEIWGKRERCDL